MPQPGDRTHNPGMCPDLELNWQPFALQDDAQPTELHQPGPYVYDLLQQKYTKQVFQSLVSENWKEPGASYPLSKV